MEFSMKEWRRMYDKVNALGRTLRDSRPTYTDDDEYIPPKIKLTLESQNMLESQIAHTIQRSDKYLDKCGMKMPKPLWIYDRKDEKTWLSHESFKYLHLLEF